MCYDSTSSSNVADSDSSSGNSKSKYARAKNSTSEKIGKMCNKNGVLVKVALPQLVVLRFVGRPLHKHDLVLCFHKNVKQMTV